MLFVNCKPNHNDVPTDIEKNIVLQKQIFISKEIQDTLNAFVSSIDSIPNPYRAPTNYMVFCIKEKNDTFVRFIAYPGLIRSLNKDSLYSDIKGGYKIGTKLVVIYYLGFNNLGDIIHENLLSKKLVEDNDFFKAYKGKDYGWSHYPMSDWSYKLVNKDSLILLYKEKGRNEKK